MKISRDINGNRTLKIESKDIGGLKGFSVQTLGKLPETHRKGVNELTLDELKEYINSYGSKSQKAKIMNLK